MGFTAAGKNIIRRFENLKDLFKKIVQKDLKHYIKITFPKLNAVRLEEIKKIHNSKGNNEVEKQILAKKQLEKKRVPKPNMTFKFRPRHFLEFPENKVFESFTVKESRLQIQQNTIIEPLGSVEVFENETQNLANLNPMKKVTPCPLCC